MIASQITVEGPAEFPVTHSADEWVDFGKMWVTAGEQQLNTVYIQSVLVQKPV